MPQNTSVSLGNHFTDFIAEKIEERRLCKPARQFSYHTISGRFETRPAQRAGRVACGVLSGNG